MVGKRENRIIRSTWEKKTTEDRERKVEESASRVLPLSKNPDGESNKRKRMCGGEKWAYYIIPSFYLTLHFPTCLTKKPSYFLNGSREKLHMYIMCSYNVPHSQHTAFAFFPVVLLFWEKYASFYTQLDGWCMRSHVQNLCTYEWMLQGMQATLENNHDVEKREQDISSGILAKAST